MSADPIVLAAQARKVIQTLHKQDNVVVRFKTDTSGYREDALDELDRKAPGHFKPDMNLLTLNLDELVGKGKPLPSKLDSIEDFRLYPVLAGVAAHESGHARWSLWGKDIPSEIPNPDFDPFAASDEEGNNPTGPESFPVSRNGTLMEMGALLEEPRIERLGSSTFTKTWRRAMQFSAGHLILEQVDVMDANDERPLDAAVRMAILVGGRNTAGTLGGTYESRKSVKAVLESAQEIIEKSVAEFDEKDQIEDPYHVIMGLINREVFNNDHTDAVSHLETARQILKIIHPEKADDPDSNPEGEEGEGEEGEGSGSGSGSGSGTAGEAMKAMQDAMHEAIDGLGKTLSDMVESEEEAPEESKGGGSHGSVLYRNPKAPQIDRYEEPTPADRELYRKALAWMERQIVPTVTESEYGQWLPVGGARLDLRSHIRDNLAGHRGSQRSDWDRVSETVKPAPPVKVAIMLDGSGSMRSMARPSAAIAWAAANASAALPESRTVSVVYGNAAQVTQRPGHATARQVAVSRTDGGTEDFIGAAQLVEDALWLDAPTEEGEKTNVLIIIVSDIMYGGESTTTRERQIDGFFRITKDWHERGYQTVIVGGDPASARYYTKDRKLPEGWGKTMSIKSPSELFE